MYGTVYLDVPATIRAEKSENVELELTLCSLL